MENIKEYYVNKKEKLKRLVGDNKLKLCIVQVGNNEASNRYVRNKIKDANDCGINTELVAMEESIGQYTLGDAVERLSAGEDVNGLIVQLPLPKNIDSDYVLKCIEPDKDVDGLSLCPRVNPATPQGIITYLEDQKYEFKNKNTLVIGRSDLVGRPIAKMLLNKDCNVTVIHSKTSLNNKKYYLENADLIICATGHRNTLTDEDFKSLNKNKLIIDVGINFNEKGKLVGDCENVTLVEKTPVPGGVGLLTRLAVIENFLKLNDII